MLAKILFFLNYENDTLADLLGASPGFKIILLASNICA
jgi:hypothetical protein